MTQSAQHIATMRSCLQQIYRHRTMGKPPGRPVNYAKHQNLVSAFEAAKDKGGYALDRLVIRESYAHRDSLLKAYKLAKRALSSDPLVTARRRVALSSGSVSEAPRLSPHLLPAQNKEMTRG